MIDGNPTPKGRPRVGKNKIVYTPKKTRDAEKYIKSCVQKIIGINHCPIDTPIQIQIDFIIKRPKYMYSKKYPSERIPHTKKPDVDNLIKLVSDSLNGYFFCDDSQIYRCISTKYYAAKNENPHTQIRIYHE